MERLEFLFGLHEPATGLFENLAGGPCFSGAPCDLAESGLEIKVEGAKERCLELLDGSLATRRLMH